MESEKKYSERLNYVVTTGKDGEVYYSGGLVNLPIYCSASSLENLEKVVKAAAKIHVELVLKGLENLDSRELTKEEHISWAFKEFQKKNIDER